MLSRRNRNHITYQLRPNKNDQEKIIAYLIFGGIEPQCQMKFRKYSCDT